MNIRFTSKDFLRIFKHPMLGITPHAWFRMIWREKGRIDIRFYPRLLFMFLNAVINVPFQLFETIRFGRKIENTKVQSPVFILGHPRSGTTHLHYLLSKDPQFAYCTVYDAMVPNIALTGGKLMKKLIASSLPPTRPQDDVTMTIDSPKEEEFAMAILSNTSYMNCFYFPKHAKENFDRSVEFKTEEDKKHWQHHFHRFLKKLTYSKRGKRLLLKSPANTGRMQEILEIYPDAKFIHISRDPYEVYRSTVRLFEKVVPMTAFHKVSNDEMEDFIIDSYCAMNSKYLESRKHVPANQLIEVRFDELEGNPMFVLKKIYEQLGLDWTKDGEAGFNSELTRTQSYKKNRYSDLDPKKKESLKEKWESIFKGFDYPM